MSLFDNVKFISELTFVHFLFVINFYEVEEFEVCSRNHSHIRLFFQKNEKVLP